MRHLTCAGRRLAIVTSLLLGACTAALVPVVPPYPATMPPRMVLRIYHAKQAAELDSVRWTLDSVSGIPYFRPLTCDACRVTLAQATIESVKQVQGREALGLLAAALPIAVFAGFAAAMSGLQD